MLDLTLRTLLAYLDDTLDPIEARSLGKRVAASDKTKLLVERIKRVTRRRGLATPDVTDHDETADPNTVAAYLDNALDPATVKQVEETCLTSDVHLAEVAACHQILTLVLTEPVRVPPRAHRRMYGLVEAPAALPGRRPNKALPIGGATPRDETKAETDDADAALLLGFKRVSATTWATRFLLLGVAAVLLVLLAGATLLSLQHQSPRPPETAAGHSSVLNAPVVTPPADPKPKEKEPKAPDDVPPPKPVGAGRAGELAAEAALASAAATADFATKPVPVPPVLPVAQVAAPRAEVRPIARVDSANQLVVVQAGDEWVRLKPLTPDEREIRSNTPVMALPGYKANVLTDSKVQVYLWGNVPEQLPYRVFESRVVFHPPAEGFDADLTLVAGRVYLKSKKLDAEKKPVGAKVRVRVATEVWDITLPDDKADVLVELISWFEPGTPYAPKDGSNPKREARAAVLVGSMGFEARNRFKKFDTVAANTQFMWNSSADTLNDAQPIENAQESDRFPILDGKLQPVVTRLLTETAEAVDMRADAVRAVIKGRLEPGAGMDRDLVSRLAIYSWAALADSTPAGSESLKELVNILNSELPWLGRQAVVTALVQWVARDRGNTALLHALLSRPESGVAPVAVDPVMEMLRGYISPTRPDGKQLDVLVERLNGLKLSEFEKAEKAIALRDVALWNLAVADRGAWIPPPVDVNVGAVGSKFDTPEYQKFVAFWKGRVKAIKERPVPMKK